MSLGLITRAPSPLEWHKLPVGEAMLLELRFVVARGYMTILGIRSFCSDDRRLMVNARATFVDALSEFVRKPTCDRYRQLRQVVMAEPTYDPRAPVFVELGRLWEQEQYARLARRVAALQNVWHLSPRWHFFAGIAAEELGALEDARQHRRILQALLKCLLSTGSGTRRRPYLVTYLSDEYDILQGLAKGSVCQTLVDTGKRRLDVLTCADGSEVWFDVSDLIR